MTTDEFEKLYKKHYRECYYVARRLVGDFYAEDMVADCFKKFWEKRDTLGFNVKGLLFTSLKNLCLDFLKHQKNFTKNTKDYLPDMVSQEWANLVILKAELLKGIADQIESLSTQERLVFNCLFLQQLKPKEVAEQTGLSVNTIGTYKMRLLTKIRAFNPDFFPKKIFG